MRLSRSPWLALLVLAAPLTTLTAQNLTPYDVFVFQNFSHTNSETNGRIAIGGDATLSHWGVGALLPSGFSDYSLVVGGNMMSDNGSVFRGQTFVGGTLSDGGSTGFPATNPPIVGGTPPVDFASEATRLTTLSNRYAGETVNGTTELLSGELNFIGSSQYNIFAVTMAMLQGGTAGYEFVTPVGATDIVNILGSSTSSAFNNTAFYFDCTRVQDSSSCQTGSNASTPAAAALTIWNFNQQVAVDFGGPVHGSILAPNADVTFGQGDVVGTVVVKSAAGSAEFYSHREFGGVLPNPEPGSLVLFGTGMCAMLAVLGVRRRRTNRDRVPGLSSTGA